MSSQSDRRNLGRLILEVDRSSMLGRLVGDELAVLPEALGQPDVSMFFGSRGASDMKHGAAKLSPFWVSESGLVSDQSGWSYAWDPDGRPSTVRVFADGLGTSHFNEGVRRFKNWGYLSPAENVAKSLQYDVLDYITQILQVRLSQTYLHASGMVSPSGRGMVVAGWGGVGKTTSMLSLVLDHGFRYLSDDLAIVASDGHLYRSPKRMQVYAYNLAGNGRLSSQLLGNRSVTDRLAWKLHLAARGASRVRRRVHAEVLMGEGSIAKEGHLNTVIHLERCEIPDATVHEAKPAELAERSAHVLLRELDPIVPVLSAMRSAGLRNVPSVPELWEASVAVLGGAFSGAECVLVRIPLQTTPAELCRIVLDIEAG